MAKFYSVKQTAQILGYSTNSIYKFLDEGRLNSTRGNSHQGRFKIPHSSLETFLKSKLPEEAIHQALASQSKMQTKKENGRVIKNPNKDQNSETITNPKTIYLIRSLIVIGFILLLIDILFSDTFSLLHHGLRILLMIILIIISFTSPQATGNAA